MSIADPKKFKYVAPGVYVTEIDNSFRPQIFEKIGPCIITRTQRGPGLRPIKVKSFEEFVEIFGEPVPGGDGGDVWRYGNRTSPMYGTYAAQAYLQNSQPANIVRLLGAQHADAVGETGKAGWSCVTNGPSIYTASNDGAYGLFIIQSSSAEAALADGVLGAVFYLKEGALTLSGTIRGPAGTPRTTCSAGTLIKSTAANEWTAVIFNKSNVELERKVFNFTTTSDNFVRKVFNTNPTKANSSINSVTSSYFLGETFEYAVDDATSGQNQFAMVLPLNKQRSTAGTDNKGDYRMGFQNARSGWVFSQDTANTTSSFDAQSLQKLFRFVALDGGEWLSRNIKVTISEIEDSNSEYTDYGTFTVTLRAVEDSDNAQRVIERFANCNLNPNSPDYIAAKIGDKYYSWGDTDRRYTEYGQYENNSKYLRVEMNADVDNGETNSTYVPFGFYGPLRFKGFALVSGSTGSLAYGGTSQHGVEYLDAMVIGTGSFPYPPAIIDAFADVGHDEKFTGSFVFPKLPLRLSSSDGILANPQNACFGLTTNRSGSTWVERSYYDMVYSMPADFISSDEPDTSDTAVEYSFIFTLDDLCSGSNTANAYYVSGSRQGGYSYRGTGSYTSVLDAGYKAFTLPLIGGFDGLDITERDPFRNDAISAGVTSITSYEYNSIKRAIDSVADPEEVDINMLMMPGLTHSGLTDHMIRVVENRGDALAIIDLEGDYDPVHENTNSESTRLGSVSTTITNLKARAMDSSYGAAYFPWVRIRDTITGISLWAPPSIVALGAIAYTEKTAEIWFAPAGFTRGGLTQGSAGIPVTNVRQRVISKDREKLYKVGINPIAKFPSQGIVIWGQKTLAARPSALDRINVRLLLNYVKKEISRMAETILFEPNVEVTWNRFLSKAEPFLASVKARYGLEHFDVILDNTTTTPDLVDRNIIYAKILLVPTKSAEQFYIDFNITNSGASFAD